MPSETPAIAGSKPDANGPKRADFPVARPAASGPRVRVRADEPAIDVPTVRPSLVKGWAVSVALHVIGLVVLGCWFFRVEHDSPRSIEARIDDGALQAGDPFGDESGQSLHMGGLDTPLSQPAPEVSSAVEVADLSRLTPSDVKLDPKLAGRITTDADGVTFSNPGKGGGLGGDGFGPARFGRGGGGEGETVQGVKVKVGDPQFTLIWDTPVDLDLHVIEPGGAEYFWESRHGKKPGDDRDRRDRADEDTEIAEGRGGELDVDNLSGFGPENVYWVESRDAQGKVVTKGAGPPGEYRWFVYYYGGNHGIPLTTHWKVRVKHDGAVTVFQGTIKYRQRSKTYTLKVRPPDDSTIAPLPDAPASP